MRLKLALIKSIAISACIVAPAWVNAEASKVTSILFEQHGCFGTCPVYRVKLERSGQGQYEGLKHVERIGKYSGTFASQAFDRLVKSLEKLELEKQSIPTDREVADDLQTTIVIHRGKSEWRLDFFRMMETDGLRESRKLLEQFIEKNVQWVQQESK